MFGIGRRLTIFKLFGFEVKLDISWLILGLLITWTLARGLFPNFIEGLSTSTYWIMGVAGAVGLLFSIVFHELWHSLIARRFGLPMKGITLFVFGGVAEMNEEPPSPKAEFFMAVSGPLSSIILGFALFGVVFLGETAGWPRTVVGVIDYLAWINLILAGFNLIPAFPLDGGRVLRSILWGWKEDIRWATNISSKIGSGFGFVLIILGVLEAISGNFIGGAWMFLIGMFIRGASQMSYQQIVIRRALEGEKVSRFMVEEPVTVPPGTSLDDLVEDYIYKYHYKMYPVVEDEKLTGCVELKQVKDIPKEERSRKTVQDIMKSCSSENSVSPDEDAVKALSQMRKKNRSRLMVVEDERLVGVVALKDMLEFLNLKVDLDSK